MYGTARTRDCVVEKSVLTFTATPAIHCISSFIEREERRSRAVGFSALSVGDKKTKNTWQDFELRTSREATRHSPPSHLGYLSIRERKNVERTTLRALLTNSDVA
jgi:hypothetical protein